MQYYKGSQECVWMTDFERYELRRICIAKLSNEDWDLIASALFDKQCLLREEARNQNCGDREWALVDRLYGLYMDIATFITRN